MNGKDVFYAINAVFCCIAVNALVDDVVGIPAGVQVALAADHEVSLFTRGVTGPDLFPTADRRMGDRSTGDYASLDDGAWDAVVDVSGYVPRHVRQAADALQL